MRRVYYRIRINLSSVHGVAIMPWKTSSVSVVVHGLLVLFSTLFASSARSDFDLIHPGTSPTLIVFVHGIEGSSATTFGQWPEIVAGDTEEVRSQKSLSQYGVAKLGYPSSALGNLSTVQVAIRLENELKNAGVYDRYSDLILICHSLGGLVAQQMIVQSYLSEQHLFARVKAVFLLGVPTDGSSLATAVALFLKINRIEPGQLLDDLKPINQNAFLQALQEGWRTLIAFRRVPGRLKVFCAYETSKIYGIATPAAQSATLRACDDRPWPSEGNHISFVKPSSSGDHVHKWMRGQLAELAIQDRARAKDSGDSNDDGSSASPPESSELDLHKERVLGFVKRPLKEEQVRQIQTQAEGIIYGLSMDKRCNSVIKQRMSGDTLHIIPSEDIVSLIVSRIIRTHVLMQDKWALLLAERLTPEESRQLAKEPLFLTETTVDEEFRKQIVARLWPSVAKIFHMENLIVPQEHRPSTELQSYNGSERALRYAAARTIWNESHVEQILKALPAMYGELTKTRTSVLNPALRAKIDELLVAARDIVIVAFADKYSLERLQEIEKFLISELGKKYFAVQREIIKEFLVFAFRQPQELMKEALAICELISQQKPKGR